MKKRFTAIAACCLVLLTFCLGCGYTAETWATNQFWNYATYLSGAAVNYALITLFPNLANTTTTVTTTTPTI